VLRELAQVTDWDDWHMHTSVVQAIVDGKLHKCCMRSERGNKQALTLFATEVYPNININKQN
jgi:hypothetical protein